MAGLPPVWVGPRTERERERERDSNGAHCMVLSAISSRIHVCWDSSRREMFSNQSLCAIPVEIWCRVPNTWQVNTGCKERDVFLNIKNDGNTVVCKDLFS